jgi:glutamate formiminotransferase/formiminotetrahydrofolate cyclodeaminase
MAEHGNPNSVSDAGVGALCARTAVLGAWLNVKINCSGYDDANFVSETLNKCESIVNAVNKHETAILEIVHQKISNP